MNNKVAIITGASSGIGKALAYELASRGANVVLAARQYVVCCQIADDIRQKYNVETLAIATDVTDEASCESMVAQTIKKFNRIDILINNAGISTRALFNDSSLEVIQKVMDVNFWGVVYGTKHALPHILQQQGSVVGISSIAGHKGLPGRSGYCASKFAIQGLLDAIRVEHLPDNLHVLLACPGFTSSNIRNIALSSDGSPQGESPLDENKIMSAETCAKHIVDAIVSRKRDLVLTGQGKLAVFLSKWLPGFLDKKVYDVFAAEPNSPLRKRV